MAMFGALSEAEPGDVIVLANDGYTRTAVFGDIAAGMMKNKGVAAFVTDGLARDKAGIIATGLPVFCQGIQPNSPAMNGPGVVGAPVVLGDVHVEPGDVIVGDADGVVVVPAGRLRQVLDRLAAVQAAEARTVRLVEQGATMPERARRMIEQATIIQTGIIQG
jgi:regulator of RNase E activity RraA